MSTYSITGSLWWKWWIWAADLGRHRRPLARIDRKTAICTQAIKRNPGKFVGGTDSAVWWWDGGLFLYLDLPYKISMRICHTKLVCGFPIQILAVTGKSFCSVPWHCNTYFKVYSVKSAAGELFAALVGAVISHPRAHDRIPPTAFVMISWSVFISDWFCHAGRWDPEHSVIFRSICTGFWLTNGTTYYSTY